MLGPASAVVFHVDVDLARFERRACHLGSTEVDPVFDGRSGLLECLYENVPEQELLIEVLRPDRHLDPGKGAITFLGNCLFSSAACGEYEREGR